MDKQIKEALMRIVGPAHFSDELIDRVAYAYDASDHDHRPDAAVWVKDAHQVSRILELANAQRFPVTPRGAGTGLAGAAVPASGGLVMDLCPMNRILETRIVDRLVVVQPGVVYADLDKALAPHGFFFPPDPASGKVCTIGGNVSTNAGGIRGAKYGVTREYVLALEVVLPDGRIMRTGSACMKSVSGYDLTRLFVGAEGTLGVVTEITLKIDPRPTARMTGLATFSSLEDAGRAVTGIMHSGIIPSVLELLDDNALTVLREQAHMNFPGVMAMILVETDGYTDTEAGFQMQKVRRVFKNNRASEVRIARSQEEAEDLWSARRSVGSAAAKLGTHNISEDVAVPMSSLADLLSGISAIVKEQGLPFVIFGHAGDGNIHPRIMYDRSDPDQAGKVRQAVEAIFELSCRLGGTITGEHGVGLAKAPYMALEHERTALDMMRAIKRLLDPNNILNPGKMNL